MEFLRNLKEKWTIKLKRPTGIASWLLSLSVKMVFDALVFSFNHECSVS